ncbi:orotidine-5'-phosphate decarboxylase [Phaeovibrio sulfidiphilus]|uniref:Orotidine 5'-phosphate decarboxylase n=1 Tax=Phaeovibrio sulfidiphilus TaxID=1220600 RepID=A0A8J7CDN5_9PROT|nr:orotidine-5'-phosphate decarboxylase [Phaeovibrio sulfidiphilus]MBE1237174.1 orotidine-5'-phosphate decarboxylase [Phaeovibrio sulfidiphilus]
MTTFVNPVYVALDTADTAEAVRLATAVQDSVGGLKLGLEYFCRNGADGIRAVREANPLPVFLDLKFHDISNTVAGAVRSVLPLAPRFLNVHASGGLNMMRRACETAREEAARLGVEPPLMLAVTILTSLEAADVAEAGFTPPVEDLVRRLAALSRKAGMDGVVCSPQEAALLRQDNGPGFLLVTPGVRPAGSAMGDQRRTMTPREALDAGADVLVIGRPITEAPDPAAAARAICETIRPAAA